MHLRIGRPVVTFLIKHQPLGPRLHHLPVLLHLQRRHLDGYRRKERHRPPHTLRHIGNRHFPRMFPAHQQHAAEPRPRQMPGLRFHLGRLQRHPSNRIVLRKSTVLTGVHALVGKIKRRKKPHRLAKVFPRLPPRLLRQLLQPHRPKHQLFKPRHLCRSPERQPLQGTARTTAHSLRKPVNGLVAEASRRAGLKPAS